MRKILCIALLSVSLASHAAPGRDETVAYLVKQCVGTPAMTDGFMISLRVDGSVLHFTSGPPVDPNATGDIAFWRRDYTIDLTAVKDVAERDLYLSLICNHKCARMDLYHLDTKGQRRKPSNRYTPLTDHMNYAELYCRHGDRVANAIRHLQSLTVDDDPFAN